jgi:hypothetical protein
VGLEAILESLHHNRIKALFAWPNMKQTMQQYVQQCEVCQQAKVEYIGQPSLLQPLPVPSQAWEVVSLDFIEGLPSQTGSMQFLWSLISLQSMDIHSHPSPIYCYSDSKDLFRQYL